jgi:mannose-6-phosphate isomerase-like protein (cupin superfamily)
MEVSLNSLAQAASMPFAHAHRQNEELYLFLSGTGQFWLDTEVIDVGPGTAIRVSPSTLRSWRNTGHEPLTFVVVQAKAGSLEQATSNDGIVSPEPVKWPDGAPTPEK